LQETVTHVPVKWLPESIKRPSISISKFKLDTILIEHQLIPGRKKRVRQCPQ